MRSSILVPVVVGLTLASVCIPAIAVQPVALTPQVAKQPNAALRYWSIFAQLNKDQEAKLREIDFDKLLTIEDARAAFASAGVPFGGSEIIATLLSTTELEKCDFEIDLSTGPYALMPHLSQIRTCARLLRLDARRLQIEGEHDEAASRIAAMLRLSSHVASDRIMISSLVGIAVSESAFKEGTRLLQAGKLSANAMTSLQSAVATMKNEDPLLLRAAVANEGKEFPDWIERQLVVPEGMKAINEISAANLNGADPKTKPPEFTVEGVRADLPRLRAAYARLNAAWDAADPAAEAIAIEKACIAGECGTLAKVWLPSMSNAYKTHKRFVEGRDLFIKLAKEHR